MLATTRATIPSLFVRYVVSMKGTVSENFIVLTSKKCTYFGLAPYFILFSAIMSESDLKQQNIYNFISTVLAKRLGLPC